MQIQRDQFIRAINRVRDANDFDIEVNDLSSHLNTGVQVNTCSLGVVLTDILSAAMDDKYDDIGYFCWELDFGREYKEGMVKDEDGNSVDLSSPDKLYDYIAGSNNISDADESREDE